MKVQSHSFGGNFISYLSYRSLEQAVPINGDNIPLPWSLPTSSRNIQLRFIFFSRVLHRWEFFRKMRLGTRKYIGVKRLIPYGQMPGMKWIEPIVFPKSAKKRIFGQIFGRRTGENEARNTKMYRGQESHPIRVNARYEMNWADIVFKSSGNLIFGQIFGHQRAENETRNTKMYRG